MQTVFHETIGRVSITVEQHQMGDDIIVLMYNENSHIGSVAVGDYYAPSEYSSCSVITRVGHKESGIATQAAEKIAKVTQRPVTVIAGIHLDDITIDEIKTVLQICDRQINALIASNIGLPVLR